MKLKKLYLQAKPKLGSCRSHRFDRESSTPSTRWGGGNGEELSILFLNEPAVNYWRENFSVRKIPRDILRTIRSELTRGVIPVPHDICPRRAPHRLPLKVEFEHRKVALALRSLAGPGFLYGRNFPPPRLDGTVSRIPNVYLGGGDVGDERDQVLDLKVGGRNFPGGGGRGTDCERHPA